MLAVYIPRFVGEVRPRPDYVSCKFHAVHPSMQPVTDWWIRTTPEPDWIIYDLDGIADWIGHVISLRSDARRLAQGSGTGSRFDKWPTSEDKQPKTSGWNSFKIIMWLRTTLIYMRYVLVSWLLTPEIFVAISAARKRHFRESSLQTRLTVLADELKISSHSKDERTTRQTFIVTKCPEENLGGMETWLETGQNDTRLGGCQNELHSLLNTAV